MTLKLVYPALAMILWIFVVLGIMFMRRKAAFESKEVRLADVAVSTERYPERARLAAANFSNQFEMPVVFFGILMLAMEVAAATYLMAGLAWAFVATRVVHTLIHTGSNNVKQRAGIFALGCLILFAMWLHVVVWVA
jgi:hypothetical protein